MKISKDNIPGYFIILLFLVIGIVTYKDYGIGWDEMAQKRTGEMSYNYIVHKDQSLLQWPDRDYGVVFELPLILMQKPLGLRENQEIFEARHLATFIFFLCGAWAIFLLIKLLFKDNVLASIGLLFYLMHPRIYGDAFHNTKDIPFLSLYTICLYWCAKAFDSKKNRDFIILGVCIGLLISTRIMGVLLLCTVSFFLAADLVRSLAKREKNASVLSKRLGLFMLFSLLTLYASWPYLWLNPFENFCTAFSNMARFRWGSTVTFMGNKIKGTTIPWYYSLIWIGITTPVFFLLTGIAGIVTAIIILFKTRFRSLFTNAPERNMVLFLVSAIAPVAAIIVLHSVLYDAWRQLFFIYPSFLMLAVTFIHYAAKKLNRKAIYLVCFSFIFANGINIVELHPFQNTYFNRFVAHDEQYLRNHYDMDYWGLSFKQSLQYILEHDTAKQITVSGNDRPVFFNHKVFFEHTRLVYTDSDSADYFITNYRYHPQDYPEYSGKEFHSFQTNNSKINTIFKLKK